MRERLIFFKHGKSSGSVLTVLTIKVHLGIGGSVGTKCQRCFNRAVDSHGSIDQSHFSTGFQSIKVPRGLRGMNVRIVIVSEQEGLRGLSVE